MIKTICTVYYDHNRDCFYLGLENGTVLDGEYESSGMAQGAAKEINKAVNLFMTDLVTQNEVLEKDLREAKVFINEKLNGIQKTLGGMINQLEGMKK